MDHVVTSTDEADLNEFERRLRRALGCLNCPSAHQLGEYELGLLPAWLASAVAAHLGDCPACLDEVRALRAALDDSA